MLDLDRRAHNLGTVSVVHDSGTGARPAETEEDGPMDWTAHARGTCEGCGTFRVRATCVTVRQRLDDGAWSYRVRCPSCRCWTHAPLRPRVALQLLLAQAPFEAWSLPACQREHGDGRVVSAADLEQLHADLARVDIVDALRASLDTVEH